MEKFQLSIPTKIFFGWDILEEAIHKQAKILQGNVMIVSTGRSLIELGYMGRLMDTLKNEQEITNVVVFDKISANPTLREVKKAIELGIQNTVNVVIGFGGGSSMDAAKVVAAGIGNQIDLEDFFYKGIEPTNDTLPIVAIPTTAGTGSELSKAGILTDDVRKVKGGIRGENLYPAVAIVDPSLTLQIPHKITMETGFDVLAHAMESYISLASNPYTRMQSETVIKKVGEFLPKLVDNLKDREAREEMSLASMLMGINLGNASTCLPHRLQYPVGAHTDTSHGIGLAAMYSAWVHYGYKESADSFNKMISWLIKENISTCEEAEEKMATFIKSIGLPTRLRELGINEEQIDTFVAEVTGNIKNDPVAVEEDIIRKIYQYAF